VVEVSPVAATVNAPALATARVWVVVPVAATVVSAALAPVRW